MNVDQPPAIVRIVEDRAGLIAAYLDRYLERRTAVRIGGTCLSACTLVLMLPLEQVCVTSGTRLGLHHAMHPDGSHDEEGTKLVTSLYPDWARTKIAGSIRGVLGPGYVVIGPI